MRTLRNYFWWTYARGSVHYDIMVTLILAFLFIAPHYINFKDSPQPSATPHARQVSAWQTNASTLGYEVPISMLNDTTTDAATRTSLQTALIPFAGASTTIRTYTPVYDDRGHIIAYDTTVTR